jgi:hypothetical protein
VRPNKRLNRRQHLIDAIFAFMETGKQGVWTIFGLGWI